MPTSQCHFISTTAKAWYSSVSRVKRTLPLTLLLAFPGTMGAAQSLPEQAMTVGGHQITAEIADTPSTRSRGLMYRQSMPDDHGMLFVYTDSAERCFWMRNTLIPLSLAFMDESGRIFRIRDMQPLTEISHCSGDGARYALEMNRGWFNANDLGVGDRLAPLP